MQRAVPVQSCGVGGSAAWSGTDPAASPALGNTLPGGDARDRGVGASSFGRGKSGGTQPNDYLHPELLSGGSL